MTYCCCCALDSDSGHSLADQERREFVLQNEIFDLQMRLQAQAADLKRLRDAEHERDEYAEALLRTEAALQEQQPRLERAEGRVAILQAEVETCHAALEEAKNRSDGLTLARQAEGFRIMESCCLLSRSLWISPLLSASGAPGTLRWE